jgi:hypothetical protein
MNRLLLTMIIIMCVAVASTGVSAHEWFAPEPPLFSLGTGVAEVFDSHQELFWSVEYRPAFRLYHFGPWFSFGSGKHHECYAAVGVLMNLQLGRGWVMTPSFGGGYYNASSGLDLGFDAEFRSGIEISKRFRNGHRLGLSFAHLSNGSLSDKNPGTESFGIVYSIPLDFIFRTRPASPL